VNVVLGGGWWPLGWEIGFVEAPHRAVVAAFATWMRKLRTRQRVTESRGPFLDQVAALAPLESPSTRELLVETEGAWTAHLSNSTDGGDSWPRVSYLAEQLETRCVVASHVPRAQYPYPSTQIWFGCPEGDRLGFVRTVAAGIYDSGRWQFLADGPEQPWEEPDRYRARLVRDRFSRELLLLYLDRLGIQADEPSFYGAGVLFQERAAWHRYRPPRRLEIAEARRDYMTSPPRP
jgi:hypothetical protein